MGAVDTLGIDYRFRRSVSGLAERQFDSASAKVHLPHIPARLLHMQELRVTRAGEASAATRVAKRARTAESVPERQDPKRRSLMVARTDSKNSS